MGVFVRDGALKIVAVVALGSLAGNVWFYCELKAERRHVAEALAAAGAVNHAQYRDDSQQFVEGEHGFNRQRPATQYVGRSMKPPCFTTPEIPDQDSLHSKTIEEFLRLDDM